MITRTIQLDREQVALALIGFLFEQRLADYQEARAHRTEFDIDLDNDEGTATIVMRLFNEN